jgi:hypothetical protein
MLGKTQQFLRAAAPIGVVLFCVLVLAALLVVDWNYCEHGWTTPQVVDLSPFETITWPEASKCVTDTLNPRIFDSYESAGGNCGEIRGYYSYGKRAQNTVWSWIEVDVSTHSSMFQYQCLDWNTFGDMSAVARGATGNGWYCISPVRQERGMAGPLCLPSKEYWSYVAYQSGNWVIGINEYTSDPASTRKDAIIHRIAEAFSRSSEEREGTDGTPRP